MGSLSRADQMLDEPNQGRMVSAAEASALATRVFPASAALAPLGGLLRARVAA